MKEVAIDKSGKTIICIDKKYFRPLEVDYLRGDASKAKKLLRWKPNKDINFLIQDMIDFEMNKYKWVK